MRIMHFPRLETLASRFARRCVVLLLFTFALAHLHQSSAQSAQATQEAGAAAGEEMPFVEAIPDPLEGFNRGAWAINKGLFRGVIYPLSFGYNFIVREPVRNGINK